MSDLLQHFLINEKKWTEKLLTLTHSAWYHRVKFDNKSSQLWCQDKMPMNHIQIGRDFTIAFNLVKVHSGIGQTPFVIYEMDWFRTRICTSLMKSSRISHTHAKTLYVLNEKALHFKKQIKTENWKTVTNWLSVNTFKWCTQLPN